MEFTPFTDGSPALLKIIEPLQITVNDKQLPTMEVLDVNTRDRFPLKKGILLYYPHPEMFNRFFGLSYTFKVGKEGDREKVCNFYNYEIEFIVSFLTFLLNSAESEEFFFFRFQFVNLWSTVRYESYEQIIGDALYPGLKCMCEESFVESKIVIRELIAQNFENIKKVSPYCKFGFKFTIRPLWTLKSKRLIYVMKFHCLHGRLLQKILILSFN